MNTTPWETACPTCDAGVDMGGTPEACYVCRHFEDSHSIAYIRDLWESRFVIWSDGALEQFTAKIIRALDRCGTLSNAYLENRYGLDKQEVLSLVLNLLDMKLVNIAFKGYWNIQLSKRGKEFLLSVCNEILKKQRDSLHEDEIRRTNN